MSTPPHPDQENSYSTSYVARRLGVSVPTVQRWVDAGHLRAWKTVGGHRRIEAASADRLFDAQARGEATAPHPGRIVIVDDNPDDRDLLEAIAQQALPSSPVAVFDSAIQALVEIGRGAADIVITDIEMPHMNGLEMIRQLASHCVVRPSLIVVVSSTLPRAMQELQGLPEGVVFMPKPLQAQPLIDLLRRAVPAA